MNWRRLTELREARGLSQTAMSEVSGVPQSRISAYERGALPNPTLETLGKLATGLGMSTADLVCELTRDPRPAKAA